MTRKSWGWPWRMMRWSFFSCTSYDELLLLCYTVMSLVDVVAGEKLD